MMSLIEKVSLLFGYERQIGSAPRDLLEEIVSSVFPEFSVCPNGLLSVGSEGALIRCSQGVRQFAVKVAHKRFDGPGNVSVTRIGFRFERETRNSFRERFVNGCMMQRHLGEILSARQETRFSVPGNVRLVHEPILAVAMDFVEGVSLSRHLFERKRIRESMPMFRQMLAAVAFFHESGVIHRDLKLENVIVSGDLLAKPKLVFVDWTFSKSPGVANNTIDGIMMGTPETMSAKVSVEKNARNANESDDVFACGMMLWQFCNFRQIPLSDADARRQWLTSINFRKKFREELALGIPSALRPIFSKATEDDESLRYSRIEPMIYDFEMAVAAAGFYDSLDEEMLDFHGVRRMVLDHERKINGRRSDMERNAEKLEEILRGHPELAKLAVPIYRAMFLKEETR